MPIENAAINDTIQSPKALQKALITATTQYLKKRKKEAERQKGDTTPLDITKKGLFHGDDGLLRAQRIKEATEAEENKTDLVALFALLYVVMSPYTLFGPIGAFDAFNRSSWLANTLAEIMITGRFHQFKVLTRASLDSITDTLKSTVLTEACLKQTKKSSDVVHRTASQAHRETTYSKRDAVRWALLEARGKMTTSERKTFDTKVTLFNTACKETDKAREEAKRKHAEDDKEMSKWELRVLALQR